SVYDTSPTLIHLHSFPTRRSSDLSYTPLNEELITTGTIEKVASTPFDFTEPISVRDALSRDSSHKQLQLAQGFDHNYVLRTDGKDRKSTRLNSSHVKISYAVFCLK